jgi:hypothetical protein
MSGSASCDPTSGRDDIVVLQDLVKESRQLRADMHQAQERQRYRFQWMIIFMAVLAVAVIALSTLVIQNQRISKSNQEIASQIADCTTSGGACWEESRQRSKTNVTSILNTTIFVSECLQQYPDIPRLRDEFEACIRRELDTGRQPVPLPTATVRAPSSAPSPGTSR